MPGPTRTPGRRASTRRSAAGAGPSPSASASRVATSTRWSRCQSFAPYKKSADKREAVDLRGVLQRPLPARAAAGHRARAAPSCATPGGSRPRTRSAPRSPRASATRRAWSPRPRRSTSWPTTRRTAGPWRWTRRRPPCSSSIVGAERLRSRSINPRTALVDYLAVNVKSRVLSIEDARRALAVATNRDGYVTALGGDDRRDCHLLAHRSQHPGSPRQGPAGRRVARQPRRRPGPAPGQRPHAARSAAGGLPLEPDRRQGDGGAEERLGRGPASRSS